MDISARSGIAAASHTRIGIDDFYWLAVPLREIEEAAKESNSECSYARTDELKECSKHSIKHILCSCISECDSVVDAASLYFRDHIRE